MERKFGGTETEENELVNLENNLVPQYDGH